MGQLGNTGYGVYNIDGKKGKIITCEDCKGDGYVTGIIHNYCRFCKGEGKRYWTDVIMRPILGG